MFVYLVKSPCQEDTNLLHPVGGGEGPGARSQVSNTNSLTSKAHFSNLHGQTLLATSTYTFLGVYKLVYVGDAHCRPTSIYQTAWCPSLESHGWHSLPGLSWQPVYLQPSLLIQRKTKSNLQTINPQKQNWKLC